MKNTSRTGASFRNWDTPCVCAYFIGGFFVIRWKDQVNSLHLQAAVPRGHHFPFTIWGHIVGIYVRMAELVTDTFNDAKSPTKLTA